MNEDPPFLFPPRMEPDRAQALLTQAYASVDEGQILRRTNKLLRQRGIDPPMDVQYTAEPVVVRVEAGLGVLLNPDILIYDEFPELDDCVDAFEEALADLVMPRLEKLVKKWRPGG